MLAHNLEWKLRPGVNLAPSVNGDTCLVEAAIIAAGLKYREVWVAFECRRCFSRPVTQYAIDINTLMPERMRETLLPFVLMLGHSADDSEVENKRYEFIFDQTFVKLMLPFAKKCSDQQLIGVCEIYSQGALLLKMKNKRWRGVRKLAQVAQRCAELNSEQTWKTSMTILYDAIIIGKNRPLDLAVVASRLNASKYEAGHA